MENHNLDSKSAIDCLNRPFTGLRIDAFTSGKHILIKRKITLVFTDIIMYVLCIVAMALSVYSGFFLKNNIGLGMMLVLSPLIGYLIYCLLRDSGETIELTSGTGLKFSTRTLFSRKVIQIEEAKLSDRLSSGAIIHATVFSRPFYVDFRARHFLVIEVCIGGPYTEILRIPKMSRSDASEIAKELNLLFESFVPFYRDRFYETHIAYYTTSITENGPSFERYLDRGVFYYSWGQYDAAYKDLCSAVLIDHTSPNVYKAYNYLGNTCYQRKDFSSAIKYYILALGVNSSLPYLYKNLSQAYAEAGFADQAMETMKKAEALEKENSTINQ